MKPNRLAFLLALALAAVAVLGIRKHLKQEEAKLKEGTDAVQIIVSKKDLPKGSILAREDLAKQARPARYAEPDQVRSEDWEYVADRKLLRAKKRGEAISWLDLHERGRGLAENIPLKERALTLAVDELNGVGGMLRPNDRVDILGVFSEEPPGESASPSRQARLLFSNVPILAVGSQTGSDPLPREGGRSYATVTVGLAAAEAQMLTLAQEEGRLVLLLRNPDDLEMEPLEPADLQTILDPAASRRIFENRRERLRIYREGKAE
jgi:pilus assembly protein CpaB